MTNELTQTTNGSAEVEEFFKPQYTTKHVDGAYELGILMPGVNREGVDVQLDGDVLTVTGRVNRNVPENWKVLHEEISKRNYRLRLELNFDFDGDGISARVEDGILNLRLPVTEQAKPRTIAIE